MAPNELSRLTPLLRIRCGRTETDVHFDDVQRKVVEGEPEDD
jgi:hypothetical protein